MENPYEPPRAELVEPSNAHRRPKLVWLLSGWIGLSTLMSPLITAGLLSGALPTPGPGVVANLQALGGYLLIRTAISSVLGGAFAISLFRLRRVAVSLAVAMALFLVANAGITFVLTGSVDRGRLARTVLGVAVWIAITLYARRLRTRGVLR